MKFLSVCATKLRAWALGIQPVEDNHPSFMESEYRRVTGRVEELTEVLYAYEQEIQEKDEEIRQLRSQLENQPVVVERVLNMSTPEYDKLCAALPQPMMSSNSSAEHTGFLLGVQCVLAHIRKRYVV